MSGEVLRAGFRVFKTIYSILFDFHVSCYALPVLAGETIIACGKHGAWWRSEIRVA